MDSETTAPAEPTALPGAAPAPAVASAPAVAAPPATPPWADRLSEAGAAAHAWLIRPRVRLSVIGVLLLLIGVLVMANSVWTLPLVIAGALMVVIAWIGHRLEGRFAVQWGDAGTQLAFRATIKPAQAPPEAAARISPPAARPASAPELTPAPEPDDFIDGEAHTIEIDVAELKALIAAAESADAPPATTEAATRDIRIRRAPSPHAVGRE